MEELNEDERLRREYEALPKVHVHGERAAQRHPEIRPEWVMQVIYDPYDRWQTVMSDGEVRTILVGRVLPFSQWIAVVFLGDEITGALLTHYANRQLERRYGGRPWPNSQ